MRKTAITFVSLLVILAIFSLVAAGYIRAVEEQCIEICGGVEECPHRSSIPLEIYAGFTAILGLLIFVGKDLVFPVKFPGLDQDERRIYRTVLDAGGSIFQGEIVKRTGLSKATVSRIIDRLEVKGILERKRRGMSNLVVLKRVSQ